MRYLPKHKVNVLFTNGGEFVKSSDQTPYRGDYIVAGDNKYFIGNDIYNLGEELIKKTSINSRFGSSINTNFHINFKIDTYNKLLNKDTLPSSKNIPTDEDYERGYYKRTFLIRVNSKSYKEVNKELALKMLNQQKLDTNLYQIDSITWALTDNVHEINTKNLMLLERKYPGITNIFPKLNEFVKSKLPVKENLHTTGNKLYYIDGSEYIGFYHIHPEKGPMVGAKHTPDPHARLYYSNEILKNEFLDINGDEFQQFQLDLFTTTPSILNPNLPKGPIKTPEPSKGGGGGSSTSTPSTPSTSIPSAPTGPSAPSSGGGGGY